MLNNEFKCHQAPVCFYEQIAINLPLAWNWDSRYVSSLPYVFAFSTAVAVLDGAVGDLVLDFACGSGWISEWLNRLGFRTVAVDISPTLLDFVKKRLACDSRIDLQRFPVQLVGCDADRLPFKDETFDGIVCMNSLHHFADYQIILEEMFRVLKKGGRASFSEPGRCHSQEPASKLEMETTGVLERDVVLSEIHTMAKQAGFAEMTITPLVFTLLKSKLKLIGIAQNNTLDHLTTGPLDRSLEYITEATFVLPFAVQGSIRYRNNGLSSDGEKTRREDELRGQLNVDVVPGFFYTGSYSLESEASPLGASQDLALESYFYNNLHIAPGRWWSRLSLVNFSVGTGSSPTNGNDVMIPNASFACLYSSFSLLLVPPPKKMLYPDTRPS